MTWNKFIGTGLILLLIGLLVGLASMSPKLSLHQLERRCEQEGGKAVYRSDGQYTILTCSQSWQEINK